MNRIIRNISIFLLALAAVSCSYQRETTGKKTNFHFSFDGLMGTQVTITATPDNDAVSFYFDVMEAESYDRYIASGKTLFDLAQRYVDGMKEYYDRISDEYKDETYKPAWMDVWFSGPGNSRLFVNLKPETEYCVVAVCVKPDNSFSATGDAQIERFTTTDIKTHIVPITLDFLLADTEDGFTYYVRPTYKGRISKELYLSTMIETDVLNAPPYNGNIFVFSRMWYNEKMDVISDYVSSDITRFTPEITMETGKKYTIIAAPFNIGEENPIYMLSFEYKPGITSSNYLPGVLNRLKPL